MKIDWLNRLGLRIAGMPPDDDPTPLMVLIACLMISSLLALCFGFYTASLVLIGIALTMFLLASYAEEHPH